MEKHRAWLVCAANWEINWFLPDGPCHQLFLLSLVPIDLTHLFKVQASTYISIMTLLTISGLEDVY